KLALALPAAVAAVLVAVAMSVGSSHREAPNTALDPTADDTDVYAYTANDAPGSLTVVANWIPFEDPAGGPDFYRFDDRAHHYNAVANSAIRKLSGGGKVFAGQRDDPFFVDLGMTFDAINFRPGTGTGNQGGGKDDLAGYNVHSIVLQVPEAKVTRNHKAVSGPSAKNAVVGVRSSTERRRPQLASAR